jgi:hypothetical protein
MPDSWQTPAAIAIVFVTLAIFILRLLKGRGAKNGCGTGCACPGVEPLPKDEDEE